MLIPGLTESRVREHASETSFERGSEYHRLGAVVSVSARGSEIHAKVEGSAYEPYLVRIDTDGGGLAWATCGCPYDGPGWCKHVVAGLLTCLRNPASIEQKPSLETILEDLNRAQLIELICKLAEREPDLLDRIELLLNKTSSQSSGRRTEIDTNEIERRMRGIFRWSGGTSRHYDSRYEYLGDVVAGILEEIARAREFTQAGDGRRALAYLEAITDVFVDEWTQLYDHDGEVGSVLIDLRIAWAEAFLTADLSPDERDEWIECLEDWESEICDYGDVDLGVAVAAARQGWDDPALKSILEGQTPSSDEPGPEDDAWYADELAVARLNVLERQGRTEEYLRLAKAEGQILMYLCMLVRIGRIQQAVDETFSSPADTEVALAVAKALREAGYLEEALRVGEHGLTSDSHLKVNLAEWVCDLARAMDRPASTQNAAFIAYQASPSLAAYQRVQELTGSDWAEHRARILEQLRGGHGASDARIDIFLHEGLADDAISAVGNRAHYGTVRQVADAVAETHPEWVAQAAARQAFLIINAGQADRYHHAVDWLGRVRQACQRMGQPDAWRALLTSLRQDHGRKYKLMGLMKEQGLLS